MPFVIQNCDDVKGYPSSSLKQYQQSQGHTLKQIGYTFAMHSLMEITEVRSAMLQEIEYRGYNNIRYGNNNHKASAEKVY